MKSHTWGRWLRLLYPKPDALYVALGVFVGVEAWKTVVCDVMCTPTSNLCNRIRGSIQVFLVFILQVLG